MNDEITPNTIDSNLSLVVTHGDIDESGHVAMALFIGVVIILLLLIYALVMAA